MKTMNDFIIFLKDSNAKGVVLSTGQISITEWESNLKTFGVLNSELKNCQIEVIW